jgi:hypothetical protein
MPRRGTQIHLWNVAKIFSSYVSIGILPQIPREQVSRGEETKRELLDDRYLLRIERRCLLVLVDMLVARNGIRSVRYSLNWMDYGVIVVGKN